MMLTVAVGLLAVASSLAPILVHDSGSAADGEYTYYMNDNGAPQYLYEGNYSFELFRDAA